MAKTPTLTSPPSPKKTAKPSSKSCATQSQISPPTGAKRQATLEAFIEMSKIKSAPEKKRLSYERDHYNRSLWNNKTWRKTKQVRKSDARRCFRKAANDAIRASV